MTTARQTRQTPKKRATFLQQLAETGNVKASADAAGLGRATVYEWRNEDPDFAAAWDAALDDAADILEAEARRRAVDGVQEPIISMGKLVMVDQVVQDPETGEERTIKVPATVRKYSDTLLIFLMKGANPEKYRERQQIEHTGEIGYKVYERTPDFDPESA